MVEPHADEVEATRRRVAANPADTEALFAFGNALWFAGEREAAVEAFRRVVALRPDHADARNNLGNALVELGRADEAVPHYRAALAMRPHHAPTLYNLGNALAAGGQTEEAEANYRAALTANPHHAGAMNNLGNLLRGQGRPAEAAALYRQVIALHPDSAGARNNLGLALLAQHAAAEAAECFMEALRLRPDYAHACNNLGGTLLALDRPEEAIALFRRAVELDPEQVQARFGESLALLALGRFEEGWEAYESRWDDPRFREGARERDTPRWQGEAAAGRTLLLHSEQGLGDTIQFVRYAPMVRALGARVVLEVQAPLVPLLGGLADEVVAEGAELPPHDFHCPLLTLPLLFGTTQETIPADIPYLRADTFLRADWRRRLGAARGRRIGLAFSGSADHPEDALRSIPAAQWAAVLSVPGVELHVVQKDVRDADAAVLAAWPAVRNHADALTDFAQTAALLHHVDLLIGVDTSVVHLAGAMGLPVWVLVQQSADFRWLRGRTDSPWYPTMRLFRQARAMQWDREIAAVAAALKKFAQR